MADIAVLSTDIVSARRHDPRPSVAEPVEPASDRQHNPAPFDLDLGDPRCIAALRATDIVWQQISSEKKSHWLQNLRITLPVRPDAIGDIALLPGGVIAARHPDGVLVCDPLEPVTLNDAEVRQLRRAVTPRPGIATLLHVEGGVVLQPCLPDLLPPQSATILPDATKLPGQAAMAGPVLIQWFANGATIWPLVQAPPSVALAATVAGIRLSDNAQPILPEFWDAADAHSRLYLLSSGMINYITDLLPEELSDDLRFSLADLCVTGGDSLAGRLADVLAAIPACFLGDPRIAPGEPPGSWNTGMALIRRARRPLALFGLEAAPEPRRAISLLRDAIGDDTAVIFHETGTGQHGVSATLGSDAALFVARWATEGGRLGVLLEPRLSPLGLYSLAAGLADEMACAVVVAAPCWGFCHSIGSDHEAGNAAWFGMGAGLDELDLLLSGPATLA